MRRRVETEFDGMGGVDGLLNVRHVAMSPDGAHLYAAALSNPAKISVFAVNRSGLCGDGIDNDGDGLIDFVGGDPGCDDDQDGSERSAALICDNGLDDDGDGWVDFVADLDGDRLGDFPGDPGCWDADSIENPQCQDGIDNDLDGGIDFDGGASTNGGVALAAPDPGCKGNPARVLENPRCGIGFELALLLTPLMWMLGRRGRRPPMLG